MGVCLQCDNETLKESDFCAACEAREFKKIRGWLYVPAAGLIFSILGNIVAINFNLRFLMDNASLIGDTQRALLLFELFAYVAMFGFAVYVSSLFFRKKRQLPRCYIALLLSGVAFVGLDLLLGHIYLDVPYVYAAVQPLIRNLVSACIWVPYFIVSVRVKRTFVR